MKAGISSLVFDLDGAKMVSQAPEEELGNRRIRRRMTRTPTLDGGASLYDAGHSPADRTFVVDTHVKEFDFFERLVRLYNRVRVCTSQGVFVGAPERCRIDDNRAVMEILIMEEESNGNS